MSENLPTQAAARSSEVPSVREFTASSLRNRLRLELEAPVSEVCDLTGQARLHRLRPASFAHNAHHECRHLWREATSWPAAAAAAAMTQRRALLPMWLPPRLVPRRQRDADALRFIHALTSVTAKNGVLHRPP